MTITIEITDKMAKEAQEAFRSLDSDIKSVDGKKLLEYVLRDCITNISSHISQMYEGNIEEMIEEEMDGGSELMDMGVELRGEE